MKRCDVGIEDLPTRADHVQRVRQSNSIGNTPATLASVDVRLHTGEG